MIGGMGDGLFNYHGKVDRYDSQGTYLGSLPDLNKARSGHACTTFVASNGEEGLLVAGGRGEVYTVSVSTELYLPSTGRWTSGENIPRGVEFLKAVRLNQRLVLIGGDRNGDLVSMEYNAGTWSMKGAIGKIRWYHAIVGVNPSALCPAVFI